MNASCEHFREYFKEFGPDAFNIIHGIFSACVSQEARRQKVCKFPSMEVNLPREKKRTRQKLTYPI